MQRSRSKKEEQSKDSMFQNLVREEGGAGAKGREVGRGQSWNLFLSAMGSR